MNLAELLFDPAVDGSEELIHAKGRSATRSQVQAGARRVAASITEAGVLPGEPIGVMLTDGIGVTEALFGVWLARAVYVPLNPRLTNDEISHVFDTVQPAAIIATPGDIDRFRHRGGEPVATELAEVEVIACHGRDRVPHGADVAIISFTSGTTGMPKPVLLLHGGILELLDGVLKTLRKPADRTPKEAQANRRVINLVPVSLSLWAGLYNLLFGLRTGALVITMATFDTKEFARLVRQFEIQSTVLPPAAMAMLADDETIVNLQPLRFVRSITAPLSPLQARRFHGRFGIGILNGYGQTEIGGEIVGWSAKDLREHEDKLGSVGVPHPGVELRLVDDEGKTVEDDGVGELWARTPALSGGYADGGDLSDRLSPDGFFRTGDLARVDSDGFVWIEGRVSDMINRGGLKIFPSDVEEVLRLIPGVADAAVVGIPDDRLGEVPWAFVVADPMPDHEAIETLCREHLAPYKVPVRFERIAALPRNDVGKVLKRDLVVLASGELSAFLT